MQSSSTLKTLLFILLIGLFMFAFLRNLFDKSYPEILDAINLQVNQELTYVKDINNYGNSDVWVKNPKNKKGDCEDFALTKMDRLLKAGVPADDLEMQLTYFVDHNDKTVAHAVLVYKDIWILDNQTDIIWQKKNVDYFGWLKPGQYREKEIYDGEFTKKS